MLKTDPINGGQWLYKGKETNLTKCVRYLVATGFIITITAFIYLDLNANFTATRWLVD